MRALIDGFYGKNNLGDDLILIGILDLLAKNGIREATVVLRGLDARLTEKISKYTNIDLRFVVARRPLSGVSHISLAVLRHEYDLIVIGGGGLFPRDSWKGHLVRLLPLMLGKAVGCRTLLLGVTVDPIHSQCTKIVWRIALRQTDMVIVRDSGSYRNLSSISSSIFGFCGRDLAFRFPYRIATKALSTTVDGAFVILAPANLWYSQSSRSRNEKYEKFVSDWVSIVRELQQQKFKVVLLPFYHPFDTKLCIDIQNHCENACVLWDPNMKSLEERVKLFEDAKLVVGMRYHAVILSLQYEVPFCAVVYDYKAKWLLEELGLTHLIAGSWGIGNREHLGIDMDLDPKALVSKIGIVLRSDETIKAQLRTAKSRILSDMRVYEKSRKVLSGW